VGWRSSAPTKSLPTCLQVSRILPTARHHRPSVSCSSSDARSTRRRNDRRRHHGQAPPQRHHIELRRNPSPRDSRDGADASSEKPTGAVDRPDTPSGPGQARKRAAEAAPRTRCWVRTTLSSQPTRPAALGLADYATLINEEVIPKSTRNPCVDCYAVSHGSGRNYWNDRPDSAGTLLRVRY
jgi:hypothetical protein